MKGLATVLLLLSVASPAAAEPVSQTFAAPVDHVWATALGVLKHQGWDIDKAERNIGWITTESRRIDGEDYGVYAKGLRHRLQLQVKAAGDNRTTVMVERSVFKRERILWIDKDEPITDNARDVEQAVLATIGKSL